MRSWHSILLKFLLCSLMVTALISRSEPVLDPGNPIGFFTNVASRLLSSELNVDLAHIEVYPTNQYTPAVHRLLQLAANIYEATTNRYYDNSGFPLPTLFQPVFSKVADGTNWIVYITNYIEYTGTGALLTNSYPIDLLDPNALNPWVPIPGSLVYGVPIIVGVKKGLPNFNAFALQSTFQITRKLQLTRNGTNETTDPVSSYKLNQLLDCSVSNQLAVKCWNSYVTNYTRPTTIWIADRIQMVLTNDEVATSDLWYPLYTYVYASATINSWPGIGTSTVSFAPNSFLINNLNAVLLPPAHYTINGLLYNGYHFSPIGTSDIGYFPSTGSFGSDLYPQPRWGLLSSNNLQIVMIDNLTGRAIDYVQLRGPNKARDLTAEILSMTNQAVMWLTNHLQSAVLPPKELPSGVEAQLQISTSYSSPLWGGQSQAIVQPQIDGFNAFLRRPPANYTNAYGMTNLAIQAPYIAIAISSQITEWQANDPLVHYVADDLLVASSDIVAQSTVQNPLMTATPNDRYQPWGLSKQMAGRPNVAPSIYNSALKDSVVWGSDYWDFPTNLYPNAGWLGRVHRGTPWQTIYLKANDIIGAANGLNTWMNWTGDFDPSDAVAMAPMRDWQIVSLLGPLMNTNNLPTFSVNNLNINEWLSILDGLTAWTNSLSDNQVRFQRVLRIPFQFDPITISSNSSQALIIANAIQSVRAVRPGQMFNSVGDILSVPELTQQSPYLNKSGAQITNGISDAAYEIIPSQLLSLLRPDSFGSVVLSNNFPQVQFTGAEGQAYVIQTSSDLVNWVSVSTNFAVNGKFSFTNPPTQNADQQFYRSVLLP